MTEIPDSPAGRALTRWLEATRAEDVEAAKKHYAEAFHDSFKSSVPIDAYLGFRGQLQGVLKAANVSKVVARGDHDLSAYAQSGDDWFVIHVQVVPEEPHAIVGLLVQPSEPQE